MSAGEKGRIHPPGAKIAEEGMVTGGQHIPWVIIMAVVSLPSGVSYNCSLLGHVQHNTSWKDILES